MSVRPVVALCLGLSLLAACGRPEKPEFRTLKNVQFRGADLRGGTALLTADAEFHNPNAIALDVTALELAVLLDGRQAATVRQGERVAVAALADFDLPIRVDLPLQVVADVLKGDGNSLLDGLLSGREVEVRVDGWIRVELRGGVAITAPVHHQERVEIKL